ncbi:metal-dependent hydrolase, partial [Candidatus Bathyarchaeota archaeon]
MAIARWLGHAAFLLELAGKKVAIDPWITGNPSCPIRLSDLGSVDVVCVTHDHGDHLGDALTICRQYGAKLVCVYEIGVKAQEEGVEAGQVCGMNVGGTVKLGDLAITLVPAVHSCSAGTPVGFVLRGEGKAIYHAGDTALFGDMALIGRLYGPLDLALLPMGGYYTMGPL